MSDHDARWITTTPEARLTSGSEKVSLRDSLAPGTRLLDEFEIVRVLGTGGFGIVYLARDHVLQRDVAIKEYLPAVLSRRGDGASVAMRANTAGCSETYARGLESFLAEARLLASFDHPALVRVHRFWRGNGTAYMAMSYYPGQTLKDARLQMIAAPVEPALNALIGPLLGALELLHRHGVFHRDIAPDNILVLADGRPVLLDFGCARRAVTGGSQWFTAHLKPQFAPLEQYAEDESIGQGPWTDLYALGATLYFVVTGRTPLPSVARAARDALPALSTMPATFPGLSTRLLGTIDWALALSPHDRPQDVAQMRGALLGEVALPPPTPRVAATRAVSEVAVAVAVEGEPATQASRGALPSVDIASPLPPRRRPGLHPGAALLLALAGLATTGWGAYALNDVAAPTAASATAREVIRLPEAIEMPRPSRAAVAAPLIGPAVLVETRTTEPDAGAVGDDGGRAAPAPKRSAPRPLLKTTGSAHRGPSCSADAGLLTTALCAINPCRDPKGRTAARCADRQRAEAERLRRMASAG